MALLGVMGHGGDAIPPIFPSPLVPHPFTEVLFRETGLISAALGQKVPSRVIFYKIQTLFFFFFFKIFC